MALVDIPLDVTSILETNASFKILFELCINRTGLQPVSMTCEQVNYFRGWVEGAKSIWCQDFEYRHTCRTGATKCLQWAKKCANPNRETNKKKDKRQTKLAVFHTAVIL